MYARFLFNRDKQMNTILSNSNYTFNASTKEITLSSPFDTLDEERILRILNLTTYTMIYDHNRAGYPISVTSGVITHTYGNSGMANSNKLQIVADT